MKNFFKKILNNSRSSAGFTLVELLVAASITTIVVGVAGYGLVSIMGANRTASAETDRRMELNRSLDFIAEEVRQATAINRIAAPAISQPSSSTVEAGTVQSLLVLDIPGVDQPVVYHIAQPKSGSVWGGPRVIYRWGPPLASNGTYTNTNNDADNTLNWQNEPLVDLIRATKPSPNSPCPGGWSPSPNLANRLGFYACIDPTRRIAELHLLGEVNKAYGGSPATYEVSSKIFARPNQFAPPNNSPLNVGNNGVGIPNGPVNANFRVIGGSITCGAGGIELPTTTSVSIDNGKTFKLVSGNTPLDLPSLNTTNRVIVRGNLTTNQCGTINTTFDSTNTTQVRALKNGDLVPQVQAFGNQTTIDAYLQDYIDPNTNKITLADNEVIYLYEMGSNDPSSPAFDLQDIVVLATVNPKQSSGSPY